MEEYEKVSWNEFRNFGNISVLANYQTNDIAKGFCYSFVKNHMNVVAFNLREKIKYDLETVLTYINDLTAFIYIDDTASSDIKYIREKCIEIKKTIPKFVLILDFENQVPYTKQELEELKELSIYIPIIITTDLPESTKIKKYPTLEDLNNNDLVDIADIVFLSNDEKSKELVLAKNNFGKVGLLSNE